MDYRIENYSSVKNDLMILINTNYKRHCNYLMYGVKVEVLGSERTIKSEFKHDSIVSEQMCGLNEGKLERKIKSSDC